ncbi:lipid-A-disaccharide synthase [Alphaproteobacteria bacterium]|nr:lipid-A-disaccharide synthase [Alphaproteobacteria bacterium]
MTGPIFILAGEPSGDVLAARMMGAIDCEYGPQEWVGIGGDQMLDAGLREWGDMDALSIIGFGAALMAYPRLSRFMTQLIDQIIATKPKLVLTIDAKGFSLRLAARLKKRMVSEGWSAPIVHTVAPTIWAWGEWRKHRLKGTLDGLLCLFPFEPDYFTPLGIDAKFIGHPEAHDDRLVPVKSSGNSTKAPKHLVILPGSRRGELTRILPAMLGAVDMVRKQQPDISVTLPTIARMEPMVTDILARYGESNIAITTKSDDFYRVVGNADAVLAASGTVTLQTALMGAPGIATYITSALSAFIGRLLVNMDKVILPNVILGREIYPLYFQQKATPHTLATGVLAVLNNPEAKQQAIADAAQLRDTMRGGGQFNKNVTDALNPYLGEA